MSVFPSLTRSTYADQVFAKVFTTFMLEVVSRNDEAAATAINT